ncbi:ParB N-terminal domain-containing protein [Frondihabitans australicus]|uniref:ParB-like nuclease family protein n=1 Tax=Frondihabitans australicus TaxID=386892 RepID=A0A495IJE7_9MICO|nr:ParB N-terminal domain-containing protein [Frondihabitans australicus]RKR75909.1 ParB-like nuclease family protein [Frondihabitans australicus]
MSQLTPTDVPLDAILLDPNNFRFHGEGEQRTVAERRFREPKVQEAALSRLKQDGLSELKQSFIANGFVPVERIVVRPWKDAGEDSVYVVVEGNRRTATLKWLKADNDAGIDLPEQLVDVLDSIPVIVMDGDDEEAYLAIMGIRHVGGVKEWGGFQAARLVYELRHNHELSAQDVGSRLGLSAVEVNRRYRAFQAMEQMRASEEYSDYVSNELYPLFHEALVSPKIRAWLAWSDETWSFENEDLRESFYSLLSPYADTKGKSREPKITSYLEIREIKNVLDDEEAVTSLLDIDKPFSDAIAMIKAADAGRNWMSKVTAALTALDHIGIRESRQLEASQKAKLQDLADLIEELLSVGEADGKDAATE